MAHNHLSFSTSSLQEPSSGRAFAITHKSNNSLRTPGMRIAFLANFYILWPTTGDLPIPSSYLTSQRDGGRD